MYNLLPRSPGLQVRKAEHSGESDDSAARLGVKDPRADREDPRNIFWPQEYWVAVKKLKLSYYIGGTLLFAIYTHYGN